MHLAMDFNIRGAHGGAVTALIARVSHANARGREFIKRLLELGPDGIRARTTAR